MFQRLAPLAVGADGTFSLDLAKDCIYTVTTSTAGQKGSFAVRARTPFLRHCPLLEITWAFPPSLVIHIKRVQLRGT